MTSSEMKISGGTLALRKKNGILQPYWYASYTSSKGYTAFIRLCPWEGTPPKDMKASSLGNKAFELSRARAMGLMEAALAKIKGGVRSLDDLEHTEKEAASHRLRDMYHRSAKDKVVLSYPKKPGEESPIWTRYVKESGGWRSSSQQYVSVRRIFGKFVAFILERKGVQEFPLDEITPDDLNAFLESIGNLAPRTWNEYLVTLRRVFRVLANYTAAYNWLVKAKRRNVEVISREIFSPEEIMEIVAMAERLGEVMIRSMVIVASCTGLRLKDICLLQWQSVDLDKGIISLRTYKTGGDVKLPIWPALKEELIRLKDSCEKAPRSHDYVMPDAAAQYQRNPFNLIDRLRRVLKALGYGAKQEDVAPQEGSRKPLELEICSQDEITKRVLEGLENPKCTWSDHRKANGKFYLSEYLSGKTIVQIAKEQNKSKGGIYGYLADLEKLSGVSIIKKPLWALLEKNSPRGNLLSELPASGRKHRASLRGWHSFRGSFIMAALHAGANVDTLKKLMGSRNVEVVYDHYVKATPQFLEEGLGRHVPDYALATVPTEPERVLVNATPLEERHRLAVSLLERAKPENAMAVIAEVLEILGDVLPQK